MPAPSRSSATDLPARDLAEIRVAERLTADGCPLCEWRAAAERRTIDALIGEAVNDVGVRRRLDASGGYCPRHTGQLPVRERERRGGTQATAVLLGSVLRSRLAALDEASASGRRLRPRIEAVAAPVRCPICADVDASVGSFLAIAVGRFLDQAWAAALGRTALCSADLMLVWETAARAGGRTLDAWRPIGAAQADRLRVVLAMADAYIDHSGHDRASELTDAERGAADALVAFLAGSGDRAR